MDPVIIVLIWLVGAVIAALVLAMTGWLIAWKLFDARLSNRMISGSIAGQSLNVAISIWIYAEERDAGVLAAGAFLAFISMIGAIGTMLIAERIFGEKAR